MAPDKHDQHGDVRRLVLDAAIAIITTTGAETLSMREVARQAGVSHQAPYHYFKDRSGIFAAIAEEGFLRLAQAFRDASAMSSDAGETAAATGLSTYLRFATENTGHFRVMFRSDICGVATHPSTAFAADAASAELMKLAERTLGTPVEPHDSFTFAMAMWSQAHGLATLLLDGPLERRLPTGVERDQQVNAIITLASHMVGLQAKEMGVNIKSL